GLGERADEVLAVMDALREADVDFLTIGQYLRPTARHAPVARYVDPAEFAGYRQGTPARGFLLGSASPPTRAAYHAHADFPRLRALRETSDGRSAARQRSAGDPGVARRAGLGAPARGSHARALPDRAADRQGAPFGRAPALQGDHRLSQHDPCERREEVARRA